jgi:hypothetical protein
MDRVSGSDGLARLTERACLGTDWPFFRQSRRKTRQWIGFRQSKPERSRFGRGESVRESDLEGAVTPFAIPARIAILSIACDPKRVYFTKGLSPGVLPAADRLMPRSFI